MSDLLKRLENLSPEKRELVLQKLKQQKSKISQNQETQKPSLIPVSREQNIPLSFPQTRLWFISQLEPENSPYHVPIFWQLQGVLNREALELAIAEIIKRHEVLRTTFSVVNDSPIQVIHPPFKLTLPVINLEGLIEEIKLQKARELAIEELQKPFDLSKRPLVRVKLLKLAPQFHILLLVIHHIVFDGWSVDIFRQELSVLYPAFCDRKPSPLPKLSLQYADFAHWQRQWLQGERLQTQLNYWQQQLKNASPLLELPTDKPRSSVQTYRGSSQFVRLNQTLTQQLKGLSQTSGTTLFMTLLTAFKVLLYRYSGQDDIVVGTAIANRNRQEIEALMGFFVNTLGLRTRLQGNPTFLELLQQVKEKTLEAYDHQDLPFEKLIDELKIERSLSHHPLFQVFFGLQNETQKSLKLPKLSFSPFEWENTTTLFDLALLCRETPQGLIAELEYRTDLFEALTIQRMAEHLEILLQGIVDNPQQSINTLPLLTELDRKTLQLWNQTDTHYPKDKTLVDLFEEQVHTNPNNIALVFEQQNLTYQELNQKANQVAHYLRQNYQIEPDTLIGICVERSLEMIIGLLGILKAGAAYVPIDPNYPEDRIQLIIQDSGISAFLTQSFLENKLPLSQVINLDQFNFESFSSQNLTPQSQPNHLAYVIYTSGSTGKPKGVMIKHQSIVNLSLTWGNIFKVSSPSRLLQFGSFSFDLSIGEIATNLVNGGCLYLAKQETLLPSQTLVDFLAVHKITHSFLSPSALSVLPQATLPHLENITVGGEACSAEVLEKWANQRRFFNCYGPTEATVTAVLALCEANGKNPSIGKPLANLRIYILDNNQQILPPGIPGELCIAGVGLARGYLNRPDLTAEKFIEVNLLGKTERIYQTGDLARWLHDGNLEFLGRIDHQIKLRGFRIELGEIEAILLEYPSVKEAVVNLYQTENNQQLVAYITTPDKQINLRDELKNLLKNRLPNYMVPSQIMVLDAFPLTANGKIDKKALPAPEIEAINEWERPITPTEELLASLWQGLLKVKSVGRRDNFFELGGHSLLATQLVTRIRESFGVELAVRKVFEQSILSELATEIDQANSGMILPPLTPQPPNEPKVLSFAQSRLWFIAQLEGAGTSVTYNMPNALQLKGNLNIEALRASFEYLLSRHTILRTSFPALSGEAQILVHNSEDMDVLEIVDLQELDSQTQAETVQRLVDSDAQDPFDLNTGPLFKAKLLQLNLQKNVLLLNMHHIISDGWSMGVFKQEWEQTYSAFAVGNQPNLPSLPIQYSDYAAWQRGWLKGEILERQENYWKQQLEDAPRLLDLPTDHPRPAKQSYQGGRKEYDLSQELTQKLKILSQKQGVSLFMTLFTAFSILLSRYSRQEDLCIGTGIANRTHNYTEKLLGFFVNTLVLRSQVTPEQNFSDLLQKSRQTCLDAYAHQDIPFEYLVEKLQPERSLSYHPLCQVVIVLQNTERAGKNVNLAGLEIQELEQTYPFAKMDLLLDLSERDGQLHCMWEYATDLFEAETIERMAGHFEVLLGAIAENPQQPISQLPLITTAEIQQLKIWNQTDTDYPKHQTLVTLFEQQVAQTPDKIAVVFESETLTYQQLNQKANQLAHYLLQHHSIQPDTLISICVERSLEMIIGMLGILKAGGAYVPIDPSYPSDRIRFILEDCGAKVLLTQSKLKKQLPLAKLDKPYQFLCLDIDNFAQQPLNNPVPQSQPNHLAYVIYTSGSTGKPKGVMIKHQSIVNLSLTWGNIFKVSSPSRLLQFGSFSFDLSIGEIATNLVNGGCLYLAKQETLLPSQTLVDFLAVHKITHSFLSPSALSVLPQATLPHLENITVGGEACSAEVVEKWANQRRFFNCYGPTEATVTAALALCQANGKNPSIGKPLNNIRVYILDANYQILPPGIPGELCIAGVGLARGYLNRPDLTAEKFIEVNLLGKTERIYQTGDLARWLHDGNLEFLGRIDHQIKLRGFRIELGEIEASLVQHPNIQEAVVILREDTDLDPRLVAYIVPNGIERDSLEVEHRQEEQVELWQQVFDDSYYQQETSIDDLTLNFTGWNDSYTGQPYSKTAMLEWRDTTVEQILELEPRRVWEIGCGTGMLLFKIAPHCQEFLGTDFSKKALQYVEHYLTPQNLNQKVTLKQSPAHQFEGIESQSYDLVILNSVIQYFPSVDYFLEVLEGAINAVATGGKILIGDVRNFKLLDAFHTAVEFYRADDEVSSQELRQRIKNSIRTEEELLIDPDFFIALKQKHPRISQVQIELKRGSNKTEMNRFRYDVVLYLDQPPTLAQEWHWLDWDVEKLNLKTIETLLKTQEPDLLGIQNIPNARLSSEMVLLENIPQFEGTVKELKAIVAEAKTGIEPEALRTLTEGLPYTPFIQYSDRGFFTYQVIFQRNTTQPFNRPRFASKNTLHSLSWQDYANQPLTVDTHQIDPALITQWREFLGKTLPDYMIPSHFVQLEKLPLTPNGKIDRKALPAPEIFRVSTNIEFPATPTEELLAQVWSKLLKYEGISRQDNFFNLGGHSLLATQLIARIRDQFKVELPVSKVFEYPILQELGNYLDTCLWVNSSEDSQPLNSDEEEFEI